MKVSAKLIYGIVVGLLYFGVGIYILFFYSNVQEKVLALRFFGAAVLIYGLFRGYRVIKKNYYE